MNDTPSRPRNDATTPRRLAALSLGATLAAATVAAQPVVAHEADPSFSVPAPAYDLAAVPNGDLLVTTGSDLVRIDPDTGTTSEFGGVPHLEETAVQGVAPVGTGTSFVARGALDLAEGAGVWRVGPGGARLVGDIETFERTHDPDGAVWKDPRCEDYGGFSEGPQSNPYKLARLSGGEVALADAAGNTVLSVRANGRVETMAVLTPPLDEHGEPRVLFSLADGTPCYVQPVATAVTLGPDGALYVGELTGEVSQDPALMLQSGLSRVWRLEADARDVQCPSAECTLVLDGMTSVVDLDFSPEGDLMVTELDEAGWLAMLVGAAEGGAVHRCDVAAGTCTVAADGLTMPNALAYDRDGQAWLLDQILFDPRVRAIDLG
ncbi:ScyD/ScyE family protein [Ornithinimicrobium sp. W1679]|uniref:ScyD/ScyE family protein n=1 Tax=Ornithinimicrobium sp. W1679 TaxID=3418770 RepID=UPI003CF8A67F